MILQRFIYSQKNAAEHPGGHPQFWASKLPLESKKKVIESFAPVVRKHLVPYAYLRVQTST